jgi:hypothetical protein
MGIIYKITCNVTGLCYIGSTKTTLEKRIQGHLYDVEKKKYTGCQVLEHNDYIAEILEECDNKILLKREGYHQQNNVCVNKTINGRTRKEYDKTEKMVEYRKKWREENHDRLTQKKKDWYEENKKKVLDKHKEIIICECGKENTYGNQSRHLKSKFHQNYLSLNK